MAEEDVTLKIQTPGAKEAQRDISDLTSKMVEWAKRNQETAFIQSKMVTGLNEQKTGIAGLIESLKNLRGSYDQGVASGGGLTGTMGVLNTAFTAMVSPIGLVAVGIGAVVASLVALTHGAMEAYREMRQLQTMTGDSVEKTEELKEAFELAGVEASSLQMALFRMSNQVETGGKALERFGINVRDQNGDLKSEGDLLLEVRDYLGELGDASQRNAALLQLFGRAGRALGPAFALSKDEMQGLLDTAKQTAGLTPEFMEQAKRYARTMTELGQRFEKTKLAMAETIALPVMQFFADAAAAAMKLHRVIIDYLAKAFFVLKGVLTGQVFSAEGRQQMLDAMFPPEEKVKEHVEESTKAAESGGKRLTEVEAQQNIQRLKMQQDTQNKMLAAEQQFVGEQAKMMTGSDQRALQSKVELNEKLIAEAQEFYAAQRAELLKVTPDIDKETELKLAKERDDKILAAQSENRMLTLKMRQSDMADYKRMMDEQTAIAKAASAERLDVLSTQRDRELALNKDMLQSSTQMIIQRDQIEERFTKTTVNERISAIAKEEADLKAYAARYPDIFSVQQEVQQKLLQLSQQRSQVERQADTEILNSRKAMVDGLKAEADREAGIGDQLMNKAMENLKKRGRTRVSIQDIEAEAGAIQRRGAESIGGLRMGGRARIEDIQAAMGNRGMFGGLAAMGSSISGAIGQSLNQTNAAMLGQQGFFMPSTVSMGAGGMPQYNAPNVDPIVQAYRDAFAKVPEAVADSVEEIGAKIDQGWTAIESKLTDRIVENFTRRIEFEAARS